MFDIITHYEIFQWTNFFLENNASFVHNYSFDLYPFSCHGLHFFYILGIVFCLLHYYDSNFDRLQLRNKWENLWEDSREQNNIQNGVLFDISFGIGIFCSDHCKDVLFRHFLFIRQNNIHSECDFVFDSHFKKHLP